MNISLLFYANYVYCSYPHHKPDTPKATNNFPNITNLRMVQETQVGIQFTNSIGQSGFLIQPQLPWTFETPHQTDSEIGSVTFSDRGGPRDRRHVVAADTRQKTYAICSIRKLRASLLHDTEEPSLQLILKSGKTTNLITSRYPLH